MKSLEALATFGEAFRFVVSPGRPLRYGLEMAAKRREEFKHTENAACDLRPKRASFQSVSTKAQAILDEIRTLPPQELQVVWRELQLLLNTTPKTAAVDPIRSARGMFAGSHLTEALLASRIEERRRG